MPALRGRRIDRRRRAAPRLRRVRQRHAGHERLDRYWSRALQNFNNTNAVLPGLLAPTGLGFLLGAGKSMAAALDTIAFSQWSSSGFAGATLGPATFTAAETGILVAVTHALAYLSTGVAYEAGVGIGSLISAIPIGDSTIGAIFGDKAYEILERLQDNQEMPEYLLRGQCP